MKRVAFITDLHLDEPAPLGHPVTPRANLEVILEDLRKRDVRDIVFGGDLGEVSAHPHFFEKLRAFSLDIILGNHDHFQDFSQHFEKQPTRSKPYYSREDDYFKYLFLDSSSDLLDQNQVEWIDHELGTGKELLLFIHHPILPVDTAADKLFPLQNRHQLTNMLINLLTKVTVFCGHYHTVDERSYKNINQFTTLSSSFQLVKNAPVLEVDNTIFGYRLITIDGNTITTEVISFRSAGKGRN